MNVFFKQILHNFLFPFSMCVYINIEHWLEYSFKEQNLLVYEFNIKKCLY